MIVRCRECLVVNTPVEPQAEIERPVESPAERLEVTGMTAGKLKEERMGIDREPPRVLLGLWITSLLATIAFLYSDIFQHHSLTAAGSKPLLTAVVTAISYKLWRDIK
jgi:hypothetical protein